jgi:Protein of unknown function (DUF3572)
VRKTAISPDEASLIALKALAYIARDEDRLSRFLALTGVEADYVPSAASSPEFQSAVLDYLMTDEATLVDFCATEGIEAEAPGQALRLLAGPASEYG